MKVKELIERWQKETAGPLDKEIFEVRLPTATAAKIYALAEMFPERNKEQIISQLLGAALDELVEDFPYRAGDKIISYDDHDDPIYEDAGHTPTFLALTKKYLDELSKKAR